MFIVIAGFVFLSIECRAVILDIIIPMNESRSRELEIEFESFLDKQQYFFLYLILEILGAGIGVSTIITTGTFLVMISKHYCAAHKIARLTCMIVYRHRSNFLALLSDFISVIL